MTESPNFRDGITIALFLLLKYHIHKVKACSQWANYSTLDVHKGTLEVFMFPSASCMATYVAHEARVKSY